MALEYACPRCHGANTQAVSIVYRSGQWTGRSRVRAGSVFHRTRFYASAHLSGESLLAGHFAPPRLRRVGAGMIMVACLMMWLFAVTHSIVLACLSWVPVLGYGIWARRQNRALSLARTLWERQCICLTCGTRFVPAVDDPCEPDTLIKPVAR